MSTSSSALVLIWIEPFLPFADAANLSPDLLEQRGLEELRRGKQLLVSAARFVAGGEIVEELGRVAADARVAGQQPEVRIELGRLLVVVARADVHVATQAVVVATNDEDDLAMGLEPHHPVGHMNAGLLELARPVDVGLFVEASLELDHHRHLLAIERRVDEVLNDP